MSKQPEQALEDELVAQLQKLGHKFIKIKDEADLLANLKQQLEIHNKTQLTDLEFKKVLNHLNKGNVFERAKILRDKMHLKKEDGTSIYLEFINQSQWCQNQFQVTQQVTIEGTYKNRYDVTLLVNGLPLVQIELKRRGLELKEAFNQVNRYHRHSFWSSYGLFQYVQVFVISNGVNTKYFANNRNQSFKQTFFWTNEQNEKLAQLADFATLFLEPCHIAKMIAKYTVLNETHRILMVLRPYQFYAVEAIIDRVKTGRKNGYIWHTTGSGKTLTSFKASQILIELPKVKKVVFVVDRKDLDYQTAKEFNSFSKGSVDSTDDTKTLYDQFLDDTQLIVTTIQKLNNVITKSVFLNKMESLQNERIVFIFDECHRSQFGDTHKRITSFFKSGQMFGFTGTPIFADNAVKNEHGKRTTKELFEECLHKYVITDAIRDENVLKFAIEYVGRYKEKESGSTALDIKVEDIDTQELIESPQRLEKIVDYIIAHHDRKTHKREHTAMFCVSSIESLISYYDLFKKKKLNGEHTLNLATIFSFTPNEDDKDANGLLSDDVNLDPSSLTGHSRDKLDAFISDYNTQYGTKFSTKDSRSFYNYYQDIAKRVKDYEKVGFDPKKRVDILLVVNMFLTGFDAKKLNTIYVDKNLKYHGLIQAFSRTNRILGEKKSQGNIVCFRNLKNATDDAITLFSNKDAKETILMAPYEDYVGKMNDVINRLKMVAPTVDSVDHLPSEVEELEFVQSFREILRLLNVLNTFADFSFLDIALSQQAIEDYKSKYFDLCDKVKSNQQKEKVSILDDVDFELELIHRDEINVRYILSLLAKLKLADESDHQAQKKVIFDLLSTDVQLRSKRDLIMQFIEKNLPEAATVNGVLDAFDRYWNEQQETAIQKICKDEKVPYSDLNNLIERYMWDKRPPLRDEVVDILEVKPKIRERKNIAERVITKIVDFVNVFVEGMDI
ncbi:type I restriction endonuclease subunit R [bacterium]|nr:type I restriction endonuclease subunit R [bacterium]